MSDTRTDCNLMNNGFPWSTVFLVLFWCVVPVVIAAVLHVMFGG